MSVRPSVRMEQLGSHWTDIHEIWCRNTFRKRAEKIQVSLKSDKNNEYCSEERHKFFYRISYNYP